MLKREGREKKIISWQFGDGKKNVSDLRSFTLGEVF